MAAVSVVVLAFGEEPWLVSAIASALASPVDDLEVVVVDNGTQADLAAVAAVDPRVRVVGTGENRGFAGGVNLGVAESRGEVIVLLNSDAEILEGSLNRLIREAIKPDAGIVGALVLLADEPDKVNSWGNPLHVLGLSWAGGFGHPAASMPARKQVASASGACLALTRSLWDRLGGFSELYFAYYEDMDLCWRCHQLGLPVTVLADATVVHHYEFSRNALKMYLLERNRLMFLLTVHQAPTLVAIAVPLAAMEAALFAVALAQGWGAEKRRGWSWLVRERKQLRELRRRVQASRTVPDGDLLPLLTDTFDTDQLPIPAWSAPLQSVLRAYWRVASKAIGGKSPIAPVGL